VLNGSDQPTEEIERSQRRLIDACMKVPLQPGGHALSAYVNSTLLGAQIAALVEYTAPFELDEHGLPILKATYHDMLIKHLNQRAQLFESSAKEAPRIQIAAGHG
jgi:hypothetical protein